MPTVQFQDLGQLDYRSAWDYQTRLHRALVDNKLTNRHLEIGQYPQEHFLLLVEHPPVYTLGKSGAMEHLLLTEAELLEKGIEFFPINRGGDITFHGPGQLVGYPVLDLEWFFTDVHRYVRSIEEVIIRTVAEYGVEAFRVNDYTGVWVQNKAPEKGLGKLCAIGVHMSRWVTLHGWAFNVNTPLDYFSHIVPCGIVDNDKSVTSLAKILGQSVDMQEIKEKLKGHFADVFACELVPRPLVTGSIQTVIR
jgi:lipoyl(octanoyl) transferase